MILIGTRPANHHRLPAAGVCADQPRNRVFERHTVAQLVPHPAGLPPQHRVLMPQHQQLSILRQATAEHQDGQAEHTAREQVGDLEQHSAS
jgi:hypothetical protein